MIISFRIMTPLMIGRYVGILPFKSQLHVGAGYYVVWRLIYTMLDILLHAEFEAGK